MKDSALALFKEGLEAAALQWTDNKAKNKKYAANAQELAGFGEVLKEDSNTAVEGNNIAASVPAKTKKQS